MSGNVLATNCISTEIIIDNVVPDNPQTGETIMVYVRNIGTEDVTGMGVYYNDEICGFYNETLSPGQIAEINTDCEYTGDSFVLKVQSMECPSAYDTYSYAPTTTTIPEEACTDSDGGKDYYTKGTVTDSVYGEYTDYCQDSNGNPVYQSEMLTEYFCSLDRVTSEAYSCPNGCKDGACIKEEDDCEKVNFEIENVKKSDEGNIVVGLTNRGPLGEYTLQIFADGKLCKEFEYLWIDNEEKNVYLNCEYPNSSFKLTVRVVGCPGIEFEREVGPFSSCTDSDGGKDYYENGKIIYDNGKSEAYDWCVNDKTLKEGYCVNGKYNYEYYNCPYGCVVGECLKSYETGKKYHLDLEKKKIFEITFNGVDYTIDTTQLSCSYSTAHKLIISYDDKTFISDRIGPYQKFNLENGDYLINSGCPTGAPVINLAFIGKKRTTTTTIPSETGYDVCNNGKGWSEPESAAERCGWPPGEKGYVKDCCCCYLTSHVHDLGKVFNEGSEIEIEYEPGWAQGCTSPMFVYYSEDGKEWNLFYNATVTQETWHPKTIYKKTLAVPGDFRYIKIYIPNCYNDYSSARVITTVGGGEGAEEEETTEEQPSQATEVVVKIQPKPPIPSTTTTTLGAEKICNGCWYKDKCLQYGTRVVENSIPSYCDLDGAFKVQKENGEKCLNNYECKSNFCSDGECYNIKGELKETRGLLESIMDFLSKLFGFKK
ncbi:MAG: discoidin domain-containing protein [Candidatus Aenigmarchaeota archaeon]|nr:discoidin domain-containing protein [Candidatus Aenigmarchaeota archaeon]